MTTYSKKLLMFASAGLLLPLVGGDAAHAEVPLAAETTEVIPSPENDKAPIQNGRLKRTDEEQEGNGMTTAAFFDDYKSGLYFSMNTELPATTQGGQVRPANFKMQLAAVPFQLTQDPTTGGVKVVADARTGKFVTNNNGDETRNANAPIAFKVKGWNKVAVKYNYQANGGNDTKAYIQIFNPDGSVALGQTELFAKNNDDAFMTQDGDFLDQVKRPDGKTRIVFYAGANGNGRDDGWAGIGDINCTGNTCTYAKVADLSLCPREERSRGKCSIGSDPNTAICTWTEGNTQPQRDGVWVAAVNIGDGPNGANAQGRLVWKKQIAGRVEENGARMYAMRIMHERVQSVNASTGALDNTDELIVRYGLLQGNNNTNGKGGTYYKNMIGVINATAAGMTYTAPMEDIAEKVVGLDGTHLGMTKGMFGTTNALVPGVTFVGGSHTGGGVSAQARVVTYDPIAKTFADAGMIAIAPHDRHLYPNYLGNNPGNQGRNHTWSTMIPNPYVGQNGNVDAYLQVFATSGKTGATMMDPAKKLSAFLSVLPIAQTPKVTTPPGGGSGSGGDGDDGEPVEDDGTGASGTTLGGCSTTSTTGGAFGLLLIGLAAFIRRRR